MSKKILIIDDDPTLTALLSSFLGGQGFEVKTANDGKKGLDILGLEQNFDLILLDVQMPEMNGYTFVFEMKRLDLPKEIPVIVLTAKEGMADIFKVEGVKEYVVKPCDTSQLLDVINKHLS